MENTASSSSNGFMDQVKAGQSGQNIGLDNGLTKINDYLYGTHNGRYYLFGAESGVGKTTIGDFMFTLSAWRSAKAGKRPIRIFYFSFEVGRTDKIARWVSQIIFARKGKRLPSDYILGRISGHTVSPEDYKDIQEASAEVDEMMQDISFVERTMTPTQVYELMLAFYAKNGELKRQELSEKELKSGKVPEVISWVPSAGMAKASVIMVMDHLGLIDEEPGRSLKVSMDLMSKKCVALKNQFGTIIVMIQQFATEMLQANRAAQVKKNVMLLTPNRLDFGDSKAPYRDADVVMGAILPALTIAAFPGGWSLDREAGLGLYLVLITIMKNRYGTPGRAIPLFLDGVSGTVEDLPMPEKKSDTLDVPTRTEFYNKARKIDQVCLELSPRKK